VLLLPSSHLLQLLQLLALLLAACCS